MDPYIRQYFINITPRNSKLKITLNEKERELNLTENQKSFLEAIYRKYGNILLSKLVFLTNSEKPWSEKRENLSPFAPSQEELSTDTMYSYYNSLILYEKAGEATVIFSPAKQNYK